MRKLFIGILSLVLMLGFINAQDTLDVASLAVGSLNEAIEGDTTSTGEPLNLNRVYRLARGSYYLLDGSIEGLSGVPLRIVGADGEGALPILVSAVDDGGEGDRLLKPNDDGEFKNLYLTGIDNLGNFTGDSKNTLRAQKDDGRYMIDNCVFDYNYQSFIRMNSDGQSFFITNSTFRNVGSVEDPGDSKFFDTRGNHQDSIVIQNCTAYTGTGRFFRSDQTEINYLKIDHNTLFNFADRIETEKMIDAQITNNLFINMDFEGGILDGSDPLDTILTEIIDLDFLNIDDSTGVYDTTAEESRNILIANNCYAFSDTLLSWFASEDTLHTPVLLNQTGMFMVNTFDNIVAENNISDMPIFSDAPAMDSVMAFVIHHLATNFTNVGNPAIWSDRNGLESLQNDAASYGPATDGYGFDYATTDAAYTAGQGGFPLGDLNWFPTKKAEWENTTPVSVDDVRVPNNFTLRQNFPNPFNPSTTIAYDLTTPSDVKLTVYNALGQKVVTLVENTYQQAGAYQVLWNGLDASSRRVGSGVYFTKLQIGKDIKTLKMIMMK